MMKLELSHFDASYDAYVPHEPVGDLKAFSRQRETAGGGLVYEHTTGSLCVAITPEIGSAWTGSFEDGPGGCSGLFATPSPDTVCVVSKGQGFMVNVNQPERWETVRSIPIKSVLSIPQYSVLIFVDYTRLSAYGEKGLLWVTTDLSWDGLQITSVDGNKVQGTGWDAPQDSEVVFVVDIKDGSSTGGSSPWA